MIFTTLNPPPAPSLPSLAHSKALVRPVRLTNCRADGCTNASNISESPKKAAGESLRLMAPPWAGRHPSLPFSVTRRPPLPERRPARHPFGEHICQMTARSVYHPLWLRQIHCHRGNLSCWHKSMVNSKSGSSDLYTRGRGGQGAYVHALAPYSLTDIYIEACSDINCPRQSAETCYSIPKGLNGSVV